VSLDTVVEVANNYLVASGACFGIYSAVAYDAMKKVVRVVMADGLVFRMLDLLAPARNSVPSAITRYTRSNATHGQAIKNLQTAMPKHTMESGKDEEQRGWTSRRVTVEDSVAAATRLKLCTGRSNLLASCTCVHPESVSSVEVGGITSRVIRSIFFNRFLKVLDISFSRVYLTAGEFNTFSYRWTQKSNSA
jgi:hypothetical protein